MGVLLLLRNIALYCITIFEYFTISLPVVDWKPTFVENQHFQLCEIQFEIQNKSLAARARETHEYPKNNQSQNSAAPGITEDYIAEVSEEIEGRVTEKLSQEFSRTESRILSALSKLDEFLLNPQIRTFCRTTPGTFRNADVENQEPSGDCSQNDPHPEVEFSACCGSNLTDSDPDETSDSCKHIFLMVNAYRTLWFSWMWN